MPQTYEIPANQRQAVDITVTTSKGQVVGKQWTPKPSSQASYDAFLGIPYGKISGRFQPAVERDPWSSPLAVQADGPVCPQPNAVFSEDCLYLNVFTPVDAYKTPGTYPVIAYIHGSAFTAGSSDSRFYGPDFIVPEGVILVTMNYRMGATGFLSLGSSVAPGNLGLTDTQLALEWVQKEISAFGGNPQQVTLAGQSAGSVMTMFHYLSNTSSGMFERAIAHSGSALSTWGHVTAAEAVRRAKLLTDAVGCDSKTNDTEILKCLQTVDIKAIVNNQNITLPVENVASGNQLPFVPVIDTSYGKPAFFTDSLENLVKNAVARAKPLVTGFTTEEGIFLIGMEGWKSAEANLKGFIPRKIQDSLNDQQKTALGKEIKSKYFSDTFDQNKIWDIVKLYTDYLFAYPSIEMINSLSNITYAYVFGYDGTWSAMPNFISKYHFQGVYHGADMAYLFYSSQDIGSCTTNSPNLVVKDYMVKWWTNFAKNGIPDATGQWGTASNGFFRVFNTTISSTNSSIVQDIYYNFWDNLTPASLSSASSFKTNLVLISLLCIILKRFL
ncbi:cholinesterase 2-like [Macrosteles quadrilineatus]|uniref:cholinesterase 2-like n=1 Tax=Macrosteles quadrilineatus TaxID=74068 RepID=UPI0023E26348|nr:cholinesterase 2-like [Macrosteles quadrilineatus]